LNEYEEIIAIADSQIALSLWHSEPCLWNSTKATYCNADARRAALSRMSKELDTDIDTYGIDVFTARLHSL